MNQTIKQLGQKELANANKLFVNPNDKIEEPKNLSGSREIENKEIDNPDNVSTHSSSHIVETKGLYLQTNNHIPEKRGLYSHPNSNIDEK